MNAAKLVKVQEVTITKVTYTGSNMIRWNVDLDGTPFGQFYTFKAKDEKHGYHVSTLAGYEAEFATYIAAERAIRAQM